MEESRSRTMWITWEEAQRLKPIMKRLSKEGPYKEVRRSALTLYYDLDNVKKMDYAPLPGHQLLLSKYDKGVIDTVMQVLREEG